MKKHGLPVEIIVLILLIMAALLFVYPFFAPQSLVDSEFPEAADLPKDSIKTIVNEPIVSDDITGPVNDSNPCISIESTINKNSCLKDKAISSNDLSWCNLSDDSFKDSCKKAFAFSSSDETVCETIVSENARWECYSDLGEKLKDYSICMKVPPDINNNIYRGNCLNEVAISLKDPEICTKINYYVFKGNIVRDLCIDSLINSVQDENICLKVFNSDTKNNCLIQIAVKKKNLEICELISSEETREECITSVGPMIEDVPCEEKETIAEKNSCLKDRAITQDDSMICETITDFDIRGECYYDFALSKEDSTYCSSIPANKIFLRDDCYLEIAINNSDSELCESILDSVKYFSCFVTIASDLEEVSICGLPEKTNLSNYSTYKINELCIKQFAIQLDDLSYCGRIGNSDLKSACLDANSTFK